MTICIINCFLFQDLPEYLATSPLQYDSDIFESGLQQLKEEARIAEEGLAGSDLINDSTSDPTNPISSGVEVHISEVKDNIEQETTVIPARKHLDSVKSEHSSRDADIDIRIENEAGELIKRRKRRRKKKNKFKPDSVNNNQAGPSEENDAASDDIFEIEDLSTDEELSRLTSNMSKSISLPVVEENKFDRTSDWASAHGGFSYVNTHPFSDTDLSPLARLVQHLVQKSQKHTSTNQQMSEILINISI